MPYPVSYRRRRGFQTASTLADVKPIRKPQGKPNITVRRTREFVTAKDYLHPSKKKLLKIRPHPILIGLGILELIWRYFKARYDGPWIRNCWCTTPKAPHGGWANPYAQYNSGQLCGQMCIPGQLNWSTDWPTPTASSGIAKGVRYKAPTSGTPLQVIEGWGRTAQYGELISPPHENAYVPTEYYPAPSEVTPFVPPGVPYTPIQLRPNPINGSQRPESRQAREPQWEPGKGNNAKRPPRGTKETKLRTRYPQAIIRILGKVTEAGDVLDVLTDAIPYKYRGPGWKYASPTDKLKFLLRNFDKIQWNEAIIGLVLEQLEDRIYGELSEQWEAFAIREGIPVHASPFSTQRRIQNLLKFLNSSDKEEDDEVDYTITT